MEKNSRQIVIDNLIESQEYEALMAILKKMPSVEVSEIIKNQEFETLVYLLSFFNTEEQGFIITFFPHELIYKLFQHYDRKIFAKIFSQLSSDVRADFYNELNRTEQLEILPFLSKQIREDVIHLSSYEPESAGGIMITDFATVEASMKVSEAIKKIREDGPSKKMIYYIYVVDDRMKLQGFVTIKDLILADPKAKVQDELHSEFVYATVDEDREHVARKIEKYNLVAIPVLNALGQLSGIISHDDALDVIRAEHTEDLEKFMGIVPDKSDLSYMETSSWQHFRKRVSWITGLAVVGILSGMIIHYFEATIDKLIILALYMPMVADTGGNCGSQSATVVVRALALGQIQVKEWFMIIYKESKISILLAIVLGVVAFLKVLFLSWETSIPTEYSLLLIAFIISFALSLQTITATIIGAGLPLIVKRLGGDPAVAASPAITTVVDITGLLIYFTTAVMFLKL
jgi:magnesium transporter